MPFEPLVTGVIETGLNRLLKEDPSCQQPLSRLKGKVISIHLQEFDRQLIFIFSHQVDVLSHYEAQPDCYLSLKMSVLPELRDQSNITRLIKQDKLVLEGDIQLAQKFAQLMTDIKPDPEEWLSRITGDVVAHTMVQGAKEQLEWIKRGALQQQSKAATIITQEWQLAPNGLEVAYFCDQVDELSSAVSLIQQRLERLSAKL